MLQPEGKLLLWNSIRHVTTHNRAVEEQNLWKQRASESLRKDLQRDTDRHARFRRNSSYPTNRGTSHSPDDAAVLRSTSVNDKRPNARLWLRRLAECKEADPEK